MPLRRASFGLRSISCDVSRTNRYVLVCLPSIRYTASDKIEIELLNMNPDAMTGLMVGIAAQCVMCLAAVRWSTWARASPPRERCTSTSPAKGQAPQLEPRCGDAASPTADSRTAECLFASPTDVDQVASFVSDASALRTSRAAVLDPNSPMGSPSSKADAHLMALIRRIQNEPTSHIFWKELKAYLVAQREGERRHGLLLQSELPIVCFAEDAELVATQIEVRSLIAREHRHRVTAKTSARSSPGVSCLAPTHHQVPATEWIQEAVPLSSRRRASSHTSVTPRDACADHQESPPPSVYPVGIDSDAMLQPDEGTLEPECRAVGVSVPAIVPPLPPLEEIERDEDVDDVSSDEDNDVDRMYDDFCLRLQQSKVRAAASARRNKRAALRELQVGDSDSESTAFITPRMLSCGDTCGDIGSADNTAPPPNVPQLNTIDISYGDEEWFFGSGQKTTRSAPVRSAPQRGDEGMDPAAHTSDDLVSSTLEYIADALPLDPTAHSTPRSLAPAGMLPDSPGLHGSSVATFFFKQLQELKRHASCMRVFLSPEHYPFVREFEKFEDHLRRMAARENPHLFGGVNGASSSDAYGPPPPPPQFGKGKSRPAISNHHNAKASHASYNKKPPAPSTHSTGLQPCHRNGDGNSAAAAAPSLQAAHLTTLKKSNKGVVPPIPSLEAAGRKSSAPVAGFFRGNAAAFARTSTDIAHHARRLSVPAGSGVASNVPEGKAFVRTQSIN